MRRDRYRYIVVMETGRCVILFPMPRKNVKQFTIPHLQVLDETGRVDPELFPNLADKDIRGLYERMVLARTFDGRALALQREGRLGTYASIRGQEASQIGTGYALAPDDWIFPAFREMGVAIARGVPMKRAFQYWSGDERGNLVPRELHYFMTAIPVGTHIPHAVGAAWAAKLKHDRTAVAVYFGDGATSKGDFHEAANIAGAHKLPVVFICQNNQWAISVPLRLQTGAETLAQKAVGYGFEGIQIDGNDVFAAYAATRAALERARGGNGPTLIECVTYRMSDHTTADDASRYRAPDEVRAWEGRDPIERLRQFMQGRKLWDAAYGERVAADAEARVNAAVAEFEGEPPADPTDMIRYTFAELPPALKRQEAQLRKQLAARKASGGEGH